VGTLHAGRVAALAAISLLGGGCGETTGLAVSAGGPVSGVVRGTITDCGTPAAGVLVIVHVQQAAVGQARPVDTEIGPDTTDDRGEYLLDVAPGFGVPGAAEVHLRESDDADSGDLASGVLELSLGEPARDTLRLDADLAKAPRACPVAEGHSGS
jgi:hypothetical protein